MLINNIPDIIWTTDSEGHTIFAQRLAKEGYPCVMANNGREALNNFYKDNFSLIISDIRMPEMDGLELLKNVKAVRPNMMLIIMTAYPEIDMAVVIQTG